MPGRNLWLVVAALIALVSWPLSRGLQLDWQLDRMFPPGDELVASYHRLEQRFGGNEVVLAVYRDEQLWSDDGSGLERLKNVTESLKQVEGVSAVLSLSELQRLLDLMQPPMALLGVGKPKVPPLLDANNKLSQAFSKVFEGYTHQDQKPVVAIACMLAPLGKDRRNHRQAILGIRHVLNALEPPCENGIATGEPVMVTDGFEMVERDGWRLGLVSTVLLAIVLIMTFRSLRWTLIPLVIVHWSILVTEAILSLARLELTMVSSMLTAIITVIGVATTMHLMLKYQQLRSIGNDPESSIRQTMLSLRAPVAWACITDAVGFASLCIANVGPVRDFGLMMAIGSMVVLSAIFLIVPGLALLGKWDRSAHIPPFDFVLRVLLRRVLFEVLERRTVGLIVVGLVAILSVWGSLRMHVETDFTKNFRESSSLVQGYRTVESELGGAGVWDIMLPAPQQVSSAYLSQVCDLENQLRAISVSRGTETISLTKVLSIADADLAAQSDSLLALAPSEVRLEGMRQTMPTFTEALLTRANPQDPTRWLRIMLRSREQTPAELKTILVQQVEQTVAQFTARSEWQSLFNKTPPAPEVTGYYVMLGRLVSNVVSDQWKCFVLATAGIYITMLLAIRSWKLAAAALVPNALPVFVVLGAMGWLGFRVNIGAAMIAAVSMGLSIDSSIHYLMHVQRLVRDGKPLVKAIRSAQEDVGLALVLATIALMAGFLSLSVSQFVPTIVFGVLVTLTMLGGLVGNLVILPLLISPWPKKS